MLGMEPVRELVQGTLAWDSHWPTAFHTSKRLPLLPPTLPPSSAPVLMFAPVLPTFSGTSLLSTTFIEGTDSLLFLGNG